MIVENGTGLSNADSYVSVAEADAYATSRNLTGWHGSNAHKEAALVTATQYIDASYRFNGTLLVLTQALAWPRTDAYDLESRPIVGVPVNLEYATIELAILALTGPLIASPETAAVKREKIKAGSVELDTEYAVSGGSSADASPSVLVDRLLAGLVKAGSSSSSLGGAFVAFVPS